MIVRCVLEHSGTGQTELLGGKIRSKRQREKSKNLSSDAVIRNLGELTPGRSILVHVPRGNERVRRGRVERLIRCFIWQRV